MPKLTLVLRTMGTVNCAPGSSVLSARRVKGARPLSRCYDDKIKLNLLKNTA